VPIITMLNQKGGVGKSSTTFHLGGTLAKLGRRVLLVDNDPQSSLTQGLIGPDATAQLSPDGTIAALYRGEPVYAASLVLPTAFANLDLLPGSEHAGEFNRPHPHAEPWELQVSLVDALADLRQQYDLIMVDCPPTLQMASWAALAASDGLIVPVQPEDYGSQGLAAVRRSIELVRETINPRLRVIGLLITMYTGRRAVHQLYEKTLRKLYGDEVFTTPIPHSADIPEATMLRKPIAWHKPRGATAKALELLAGEVLARLESGSTPETQEEAA
jgi:chromosome partitioning protein